MIVRKLDHLACLKCFARNELILYSIMSFDISAHVPISVQLSRCQLEYKCRVNLIAIVQDTCRMGVWLGWHICYNATQVSQGQLRENRNLSSSIRAKAVLIYVLSVPVHNE